MGRTKQHPLIIAMNKLDRLIDEATNGLDVPSYEAFAAYLQNKMAVRPKPRSTNGAGKKHVAKVPTNATAMKDLVCSTCNEHAAHPNHDSTYLSSHPFASSSDAPSAKRKSSSKKEPKVVGAPSSPTDMGIALSANASETEHEHIT